MSLPNETPSQRLPSAREHRLATRIINIIGGPGCGKSLFCAAIIVQLHLRNKAVEQVPDLARVLAWQGDHEALRNQYGIARQQFRMLELLQGQADYLVTDCSLPQLLYYNAHYPDNVCDVARTRTQILEWYRRHDNVNLLVERADRPYMQAGRFQDEHGAREADRDLRLMLDRERIAHTIVRADIDAINAFASALV